MWCSRAASDRDLVGALAKGDRSAFDHLSRQYRPQLTRVAWSYLRSHEDAEDVVQETFARALEGIDRLEHPESLSRWMCGIAANVCRESLRQRARLVLYGALHDPVPGFRDEAADPWHASCALGALTALARLPLPQRSLLVLRCLEGSSLDEIRRLFGISLAAAKMRLLRARAAAQGASPTAPADAGETAKAMAYAYHHLASLCFTRGRWADLRRFWERALAHAPSTADHVWATFRNDMYMNSTLTWTARDRLAAPSDRPAVQKEALAPAVQALEARLRRHPDDGALWLTLGKVLLFGGRSTDPGIAAFDRAAQDIRFTHWALMLKAIWLALSGCGDGALSCLERMERENLWDHQLPLVRALAFESLGQREGALREARNALRYAEKNSDPYWVAHRYHAPGRILARFGRKQEALRAYSAALRAGPPLPMRAAIEMDLQRLAS